MISLIVLNDIVNQNRELLQELRKFIKTLYEKGLRLKYHNNGWYIPRKSLNNNEIDTFNSIYYNIKSSNDLIEPTIINIDKQNEIYQIIMRKNYLIMKSINILISMYNPYTTNYNNFNIQQLDKNNIHIKFLNKIVEDKMASMLKPQDKTMSIQNLSHSDKSISSNQLINNIVNNLETLLEELRNFTDTFYIKELRLTNRDGGWYVKNKSLNNNVIDTFNSIYYNIKSSNDLIEPTIINIDKQNEIYQIIMRKNYLIMKSINILISMYNPYTTNYNNFNIQQLDKNNIHIKFLNNIVEDKMASMLKPLDTKTSRQKLSHSDKSKSSNKISSSRNDKSNPIVEDKTKSQSKYSHSYNSKSSRTISLSNYIIDNNNSELLLINAIGDGDCFINAIFDYGLYTGNLSDIYDRLIHFELLIENLPKYKDSINKAKSLFDGPPPKLDKLTKEEYATILYKTLIKESDTDTAYFKDRYKIPETQLLTCYNHPIPEDRNIKSKAYEIERKKFIKFMKYIQVLYVYTYGYIFIINKLTNLFNIANTTDLIEIQDFDRNFIAYIKNIYYKNDKLKENINISIFLDDYMNFYAKNEGYYSGGDQISIFQKIFFKKLKIIDSEKSIPCFWLNYKNIELSTKNIKFMKTLRESAEEEDKNKKFISIIRDDEHFKLFVYRDQSIIFEDI